MVGPYLGIRQVTSVTGAQGRPADGRMMAVPVATGADDFTYGRPASLFISTAPYFTGQHPGRAALLGRTYDGAPDGRFLLIKPPADASTLAPQAVIVVQHWVDEVRQRLGQ